MALKLRICVRFASTFNVVRVAVLTYDLVICKDSNDCLLISHITFIVGKHHLTCQGNNFLTYYPEKYILCYTGDRSLFFETLNIFSI